MRKCKQVISLILVLTLLFAMMSVGIVQTAAADGENIYTNPPSEPALLGDVNRDGRVNMQDVYVLRSSIANKSGYLNYKEYAENTIEFKVADVFKDYELGMKETIDLKDVYLLRQWLAHQTAAQDKGIGEPVDVDPEPTEAPTQEPTQAPTQPKPTDPPVPTEAPTVAPKPTEAPTEAPKPTEAPTEPPKPTEAPTEAPKPTEAPTEAPKPTEEPAKTATITIYGLNGQSETKEFNIGDTFTVYTSLDATLATDGGKIASIAGSQTYTDSVLSLTSAIDGEQLFIDSAAVFPVCGNQAMGRLTQPGTILYNASTPSTTNPFVFDSDDDLMLVTTYTVTAGGTGEVRNVLTSLAAADDALTRLVNKGTPAPGVELTVNATFDKPVPQPTEAPTEAPKPTEAPTEPTPARHRLSLHLPES